MTNKTYTHSICRDDNGNDPGNCPCTDPNCTGYDPTIEPLEVDGFDDSLYYPTLDSDIAREAHQ